MPPPPRGVAPPSPTRLLLLGLGSPGLTLRASPLLLLRLGPSGKSLRAPPLLMLAVL